MLGNRDRSKQENGMKNNRNKIIRRKKKINGSESKTVIKKRTKNNPREESKIV